MLCTSLRTSHSTKHNTADVGGNLKPIHTHTQEAHLFPETPTDSPLYLVFVRFFDLISACLSFPSCSFFSLVCHFFRHLPDGPRCPWIFCSSTCS